jgi:hypothetical protein
MESGHTDREVTPPASAESAGPQGYPTNHVLGVVNSEEQAERTVDALTSGGFLESEIHVVAGEAAADAIQARTGRSGLRHLVIRLAERLGIADDEMEVRARYEQSLRDGGFLLLVDAPTEARQERAVQILGEHGAHSVNFMGRFSRTAFSPPEAPQADTELR